MSNSFATLPTIKFKAYIYSNISFFHTEGVPFFRGGGGSAADSSSNSLERTARSSDCSDRSDKFTTDGFNKISDFRTNSFLFNSLEQSRASASTTSTTASPSTPDYLNSIEESSFYQLEFPYEFGHEVECGTSIFHLPNSTLSE